MYVHVYRAFAAPWRTVDNGCAVGSNAYHRVVVVDECAAFDVFDPFVAVGTLALAACSEEHVALAAVLNGGRVHEQGMVLGCAHGEDDHQCVVEPECDIAFVATGGDGEVPAFGVALHEGAWVSVLVDGEYLVCTAVLTVYFELCTGAGKCSYFLSTPRWLYVVVRCYLEQNVVALLALKRGKVG